MFSEPKWSEREGEEWEGERKRGKEGGMEGEGGGDGERERGKERGREGEERE